MNAVISETIRARLLGFGKQIQASVQIRELLTQQSTKLGLGMQIGGNTGIRHAGSSARLFCH